MSGPAAVVEGRVESILAAYFPALPKPAKSRSRKKNFGEKVRLGKLFKGKDHPAP